MNDTTARTYLALVVQPAGRGLWRHAGRRYEARRFAGEQAPRLGSADFEQLLRAVNAARPRGVAPITPAELAGYLTS